MNARAVEYDGKTYKVRGKVDIPDFDQMSRFEALQWLSRHTYAKGYSKAPSPLTGFGGSINVEVQR